MAQNRGQESHHCHWYSQGYGWKRPFLRSPGLAEPWRSLRRRGSILGLPCHIGPTSNSSSNKEEGLKSVPKWMPKSPVQRQGLPPPAPSLLEKQFWNSVLGAVGNVQCVWAEQRQCELDGSCLAVCSHLSPTKNIQLSLSKMLSGYE